MSSGSHARFDGATIAIGGLTLVGCVLFAKPGLAPLIAGVVVYLLALA